MEIRLKGGVIEELLPPTEIMESLERIESLGERAAKVLIFVLVLVDIGIDFSIGIVCYWKILILVLMLVLVSERI